MSWAQVLSGESAYGEWSQYFIATSAPPPSMLCSAAALLSAATGVKIFLGY